MPVLTTTYTIIHACLFNSRSQEQQQGVVNIKLKYLEYASTSRHLYTTFSLRDK